jgi:hypothetical protein
MYVSYKYRWCNSKYQVCLPPVQAYALMGELHLKGEIEFVRIGLEPENLK